mgnify:FL=1
MQYLEIQAFLNWPDTSGQFHFSNSAYSHFSKDTLSYTHIVHLHDFDKMNLIKF